MVTRLNEIESSCDILKCVNDKVTVNDNYKNEKAKEDDWGNHPSHDTPENRKKAQNAQLIIGIVALVGIFLTWVLFWLMTG